MGAQENISDHGLLREQPPSYEDDSDTNMVDDHITPLVSVEEDDEKAIDIRLDGSDPFVASWTPPPEQDPGHAVAAVDAVSSPDLTSLYVPGLAMKRATGISDDTTHVCIDLIALDPAETASQGGSVGSGGRRGSSSSSVATGESSGATSAEQASLLTPITRRDLEDAMPHPHAVLSPDRMEWFVVLRQEDHVVDSAKFALEPVYVPDVEGEGLGAGSLPLWRDEGTVNIPAQEQKRSVFLTPPLLTRDTTVDDTSLLKPIETFHRLNSTQGGALLMTAHGQIGSVVPRNMLETFKQRRLDYTAPNVKPVDSFRESANVLIQIVGNAANGETRAIGTTNKVMVNKLVIDDASMAILAALGFRPTGEADDAGRQSFIRPPDMSVAWQIRTRRAWIELNVWLEHSIRLLRAPEQRSTSKTTVAWRVKWYDPSPYIYALFGFDKQRQEVSAEEQRGYRGPMKYEWAFEDLGVEYTSSDETIAYAYKVNSTTVSPRRQLVLFEALHNIYVNCRSQSEILGTLCALGQSSGLYTSDDVVSAFKTLDLATNAAEAPNIEDEIIAACYKKAANRKRGDALAFQDVQNALRFISKLRGPSKMLEDLAEAPVEIDYETACKILNTDADMADDFVEAMHAVALSEGRFSEDDCHESLRVIAEHRNSAMLLQKWRSSTGVIDEAWELAKFNMPAGLNNIGNTCYLNSVLQYFFAIRELRERVLQASINLGPLLAAEDKDSGASTPVRVSGRKVSGREIKRSQRFVAQLAQLFSAMITSPAPAVTPERELAYLALVSSRVEEESDVGVANADNPEKTGSTERTLVEEPGTMMPTDTQAAKADDVDHSSSALEEEKKASTSVSTQTMPSDSNTAKGPPLPPRPSAQPESGIAAEALVKNDEAGFRQNSLMQLGAQQDVSECLDNVMFQVEAALVAAPDWKEPSAKAEGDARAGGEEEDDDDENWSHDADLLRRLFLGRTCQRLELAVSEQGKGPSIHTKKEVFKILPIDVLEEGRDIYDGLDGFFDEETLTGTGGAPVTRSVTLMDPPAIVQIQLQRVQYDRVRGAFKSQAHLEMGETLYMDRYLDFDPSNAEDQARLVKRRQGRQARAQIAKLRNRVASLQENKRPLSRTLEETASFIKGLKGLKSPLLESVAEDEEQMSPLAQHYDEGIYPFFALEAKRIDEEIKATEDTIRDLKTKVESLWSDEKRVEYVLASVFMHRGEANHGHYFLNQRRLPVEESSSPSKWFKYNDSVVTEASVSDVLKDATGATPYLLSYVRKDIQDEIMLFQTVKRDVEGGAIGVAPPAPAQEPEKTAEAPATSPLVPLIEDLSSTTKTDVQPEEKGMKKTVMSPKNGEAEMDESK